MKKKVSFIIITSFFIVAGICYIIYFSNNVPDNKDSLEVIISSGQEMNEEAGIISEEEKEEEKETVSVYVCGAVNNPGVYVFEYGARVIEGIEAAGGFSESAEPKYLNLAQKMTDEQRIYVLSEEEVEEGMTDIITDTSDTAASDDSGRININTATAKELTALSGIGDKKAENIVNYREKNGYFKNIKDLVNVEGISETLYKNIEDKITV